MPRTPTTPAQVSGHRFLVRRLEHALVRADARMLHDPLRTRGRAMAVGIVLVVLLIAGTAVLELVRPRGVASAHADLLIVAESGALHVRINDALHPVSNLASARLILGSAKVPQRVREEVLAEQQVGHPVGIPHAPTITHEIPAAAPVAWGVCDYAESDLHKPVTVRSTIARSGAVPNSAPVSALVHDGEHSWLLHNGTRALIDPTDPVLSRALGLTTTTLRPVNPQLLAVVPEVEAVVKPEIARMGYPSGFPAPFETVGKVVEVGSRFVAVMEDGAVDVPPVTARVLAAYGGLAEGTEPELASIPVGTAADFGSLPAEMPRWAAAEGWLCADSFGEETVVTVIAADVATAVHEYPWADGEGSGIDGYLAGHSGTVAVDVGSSVQLISEAGMRFGVEDRQAVDALGYSEPAPVVVPWRVVSVLPAGPELTRQAALLAVATTESPEAATDN